MSETSETIQHFCIAQDLKFILFADITMFLEAVILLVGVAIALFLQTDCDFYLQFSPYNETNAFENKVVWIVGASSGIGEYLAYDMGRAGAKVIISARRLNQLQTVASKFKDFKHQPLIVSLDILNQSNQQIAYDDIIKKCSQIDYVVLNAGRSMRATAIESSVTLTRDIFELNFFSYIELIKLVLPKMVHNKNGHVVVVSSMAGKLGTPIASSYSASKFALVRT